MTGSMIKTGLAVILVATTVVTASAFEAHVGQAALNAIQSAGFNTSRANASQTGSVTVDKYGKTGLKMDEDTSLCTMDRDQAQAILDAAGGYEIQVEELCE